MSGDAVEAKDVAQAELVEFEHQVLFFESKIREIKQGDGIVGIYFGPNSKENFERNICCYTYFKGCNGEKS